MNGNGQPTKSCARCGRIIQWRRKWAKEWSAVKYCSKACRSAGLTPVDHALEAIIIKLLRHRNAGASICPSEAARAVAGKDRADSRRSLMEASKQAARRLAANGVVEILQRGNAVDPSTAKGPIRLRLIR